MVRDGQSTGPSGLRSVKGQPTGANPLQVLNPEQSQDEDDNVVVVDDSEMQLEDEEVLASKGQGRVGSHGGQRVDVTQQPPTGQELRQRGRQELWE